MLLGAAWPDGLPAFSADLLWAALALAGSYVAATSVNDIADVDVDRINHPGDRARPLVTGEARERDLWRLHVLASATALLAAAPLGWAAVGVVAGSLAVGIAYSLPPLRVSYRTWLAPLLLSVAYVPVPFALGVLASGREPGPGDAWLAVALSALFSPGSSSRTTATGPATPATASRRCCSASARPRPAPRASRRFSWRTCSS